jgi:2-polyprenyl-6-methoxyphenol hydroxylase-like FAD-dependent oxidoreductase
LRHAIFSVNNKKGTQMTQPQVLIVGAGPTGLVLAIWLRKKGINIRIIDKSIGPGTTSRALAVQARTLEFYHQLGISDELIEAGITVREFIMRRKGKEIARAKIGALGKDVSPFPYLLFCSQDIHENILCDVLRSLGTEVERQTELVDFNQNEKGTTSILNSPNGKETVSAEYICGCDGAHSLVRHHLPTDFPGGSYSQVFFVADVIAEGEAAKLDLQISLSYDDFCIIMPIKSLGSIRLTGIVPPASEKKDNISYADVAHSVERNTGLKVKQVNWFSSYRVHHRVAEDFHKGRVFLAGDAGHIHSPAGGQGMNTGIGDAVNLAWKLADVLNGCATKKLLDSYELERISFAKTLVKTTDTAFRFIASRSVLGSLFRAYILPIFFSSITKIHLFLKMAFRTISQTRINYRESFLSVGSGKKIKAGDRLPWIKSGQGDNFENLRSLDWQIHIYGIIKNEFRKATKNLKYSIYEFEWSQEAKKKGMIKNALYLIRPDGHIALVSKEQNANLIEKYFKNL